MLIVLSVQITDLLTSMGADLVGFGDVSGLAPDGYHTAVVAAIPLPLDIIDEIPIGPNPAAAAALPVWTPAPVTPHKARCRRQIPRSLLVDPTACQQTAGALAQKTLGHSTTICGRCFAACPYTKAYVNRARSGQPK